MLTPHFVAPTSLEKSMSRSRLLLLLAVSAALVVLGAI